MESTTPESKTKGMASLDIEEASYLSLNGKPESKGPEETPSSEKP